MPDFFKIVPRTKNQISPRLLITETNNLPHTWLSLSHKGHKAFNGHVEALKEIVG